jgi:hypothetical protein
MKDAKPVTYVVDTQRRFLGESPYTDENSEWKFKIGFRHSVKCDFCGKKMDGVIVTDSVLDTSPEFIGWGEIDYRVRKDLTDSKDICSRCRTIAFNYLAFVKRFPEVEKKLESIINDTIIFGITTSKND